MSCSRPASCLAGEYLLRWASDDLDREFAVTSLPARGAILAWR